MKQNLWNNGSFWDISESTKGSWVWQKLLRLRPLVSQFIRVQVNNGQTTFFWLDQWLLLGRLIDIVGDSGPQRLGVGRFAKVADVANDSGWQFRRCRDLNLQQIIATIGNVQAPAAGNADDVVLWRAGPGEFNSRFSSSKTWEQIRDYKEKHKWSKVIWFAQGVPRFGFITWLAIRDRLATGTKMLQWGVVQGCVFCGEPSESRDHLFFACPYTFTVWLEVVGDLLEASADPDWEATLARLVDYRYEKLTFILLRLVFQTAIYYIWKERNDRRHNGKLKTTTQLSMLIEKTVKTGSAPHAILRNQSFWGYFKGGSESARKFILMILFCT